MYAQQQQRSSSSVNKTRLPEQSTVRTEVQTPPKTKQQEFNFADIPLFPKQSQVTPNFSRPNPYKQQQQQPQVTPNFSRPNPYKQQQQQQPQERPSPIRPPEKEAELLLTMDYTAREQAIKDLRQKRRPEFVNLIIEKLEDLERQKAVIRGLEGRIPSQEPQQEQPSETRMEEIKKRMGKCFGTSKESRQKIAEGADK